MCDRCMDRCAARLWQPLALGFVVLLSACGGDDAGGSDAGVADARWEPAFDTSEAGTLSAVWGSGPSDVFIVGGEDERGEIYHYDGASWEPMDVPSGVPFLVWVYGFGPDDVYAVGRQGAVIHYDGEAWTALDSGSSAELWGVFGFSADDLWMVGEGEDGTPEILHYDGAAFTEHELDENPRQARALLKVWGIDGRLVAVGENGTIAEYTDGSWSVVSTGAEATESFVSVWGTGADNLVAVGGETRAQVATSDGGGWETTRFSQDPALNGSFVDDPDLAIVVGLEGFMGRYDIATGELIREPGDARLRLHSVWGDGQGRYYGVGGTFFSPHEGEAYVRVID